MASGPSPPPRPSAMLLLPRAGGQPGRSSERAGSDAQPHGCLPPAFLGCKKPEAPPNVTKRPLRPAPVLRFVMTPPSSESRSAPPAPERWGSLSPGEAAAPHRRSAAGEGQRRLPAIAPSSSQQCPEAIPKPRPGQAGLLGGCEEHDERLLILVAAVSSLRCRPQRLHQTTQEKKILILQIFEPVQMCLLAVQSPGVP